MTAVTEGDPPAGLVTSVLEADGLVTEAKCRIAGFERELAALQGTSDSEALREAPAEFDGVWGALLAERARVLALVPDEVVVDGVTGDAALRFRGSA